MSQYDKQQQSKQDINLKIAVKIGENLVKQKQFDNIHSIFQRIHQYSIQSYKQSLLFCKILNKITYNKIQSYKKYVFSVIHQAKLFDILIKKQKVFLLKQRCKNQSTSLISSLLSKNIKNKIRFFLSQIKSKSIFIKQRKTLKCLKLANSIKTFEIKSLRNAFKIIKISLFNYLSRQKRCFVIDKIFVAKRLQNLSYALNEFRKKPCFVQILDSKPSINVNEVENLIEQKILKQLQDQKKGLQKELARKNSQSRASLQQKQQQLQRIEKEYESIRFNYQLLGQENNQLCEALKQQEKCEQNMLKEKEEQNQRKSSENTNKWNQSSLWESIFDNLIHYLYQLKSYPNNLSFNAQTLIEKITQPAIRLSPYTSLQELEEENAVLKDLLQSYNDGLGSIQSQQTINLLTQQATTSNTQIFDQPLEILYKERKKLYEALYYLSKWAITDSQGIEQIKYLFNRIKNKVEGNNQS